MSVCACCTPKYEHTGTAERVNPYSKVGGKLQDNLEKVLGLRLLVLGKHLQELLVVLIDALRLAVQLVHIALGAGKEGLQYGEKRPTRTKQASSAP